MRTTDNTIIRQFLAGRAKGPIGMDEMATTRTRTSELDDDDATRS